MSGRNPRCVFVGNIPYDATEKQLVDLFSQVNVRQRLWKAQGLREIRHFTDSPKGFGFCEYRDTETALSAMRNLNNVDFNGRQLRVDFAENDKGQGTAPVAPTPGKPMTIANVLEGFTVSQLYEIISQMKLLIQNNAAQARAILAASPQLSYALLNAAVLLGMLQPAILQQIITQVQQSVPPPIAPSPVYTMPAPAVPAPIPTAYPPAPSSGFSPPLVQPPAPHTGFSPAISPSGAAAPAGFLNLGLPVNADVDTQRALLQQLRSLTHQQIMQLPPEHRTQVAQLIQILQASVGQR